MARQLSPPQPEQWDEQSQQLFHACLSNLRREAAQAAPLPVSGDDDDVLLLAAIPEDEANDAAAAGPPAGGAGTEHEHDDDIFDGGFITPDDEGGDDAGGAPHSPLRQPPQRQPEPELAPDAAEAEPLYPEPDADDEVERLYARLRESAHLREGFRLYKQLCAQEQLQRAREAAASPPTADHSPGQRQPPSPSSDHTAPTGPWVAPAPALAPVATQAPLAAPAAEISGETVRRSNADRFADRMRRKQREPAHRSPRVAVVRRPRRPPRSAPNMNIGPPQ